jgi:hypothetical protein
MSIAKWRRREPQNTGGVDAESCDVGVPQPEACPRRRDQHVQLKSGNTFRRAVCVLSQAASVSLNVGAIERVAGKVWVRPMAPR